MIFIKNQTDNQLNNFKMTFEEEKHIRKAIQQGLKKKFSLSETDLIAPNANSWESIKGNFKEIISNLISNLENDDYDDATGDINKAISMLKKWKQKIEKDISDSMLKENVPSLKQVVSHYIGEEGYYFKYIIPGSEKLIPNEQDGGYVLKCMFSVPKSDSENFDIAIEEAEKSLAENSYQGQGQSFTKTNIWKVKETNNSYIIGYELQYGYDV